MRLLFLFCIYNTEILFFIFWSGFRCLHFRVLIKSPFDTPYKDKVNYSQDKSFERSLCCSPYLQCTINRYVWRDYQWKGINRRNTPLANAIDNVFYVLLVNVLVENDYKIISIIQLYIKTIKINSISEKERDCVLFVWNWFKKWI